MAFLDCFLHPATGFFLLGLILPFFRGRFWRWFLFVPPLYAISLAFRMKLELLGPLLCGPEPCLRKGGLSLHLLCGPLLSHDLYLYPLCLPCS